MEDVPREPIKGLSVRDQGAQELREWVRLSVGPDGPGAHRAAECGTRECLRVQREAECGE